MPKFIRPLIALAFLFSPITRASLTEPSPDVLSAKLPSAMMPGNLFSIAYSKNKKFSELLKAMPLPTDIKEEFRKIQRDRKMDDFKLPAMTVRLDEHGQTFIFKGEKTEWTWSREPGVARHRFIIDGHEVAINHGATVSGILHLVEHNRKSAGFFSLLLPEAKATWGPALAIAAGIVVVNYQFRCDKTKDSMCLFGTDAKRKLQEIEAKQKRDLDSVKYYREHRPALFSCENGKVSRQVGDIEYAIKMMDPTQEAIARRRTFAFTYGASELPIEISLTNPACVFKVDASGIVQAATRGGDACEAVRTKVPYKDFAGVWGINVDAANRCCKSSCKQELDTLITYMEKRDSAAARQEEKPTKR